ncbi:MAG: hypothetical protein ACFFE8_17030 [Candidatus Heimdallarchaeota archaeon]
MTLSRIFLEKLDIIIVTSLIILIAVFILLTQYWDGIILMVFLFGNQLWNECEKKKLRGKDPMTLSKNKLRIIAGVLLTTFGTILLVMSYISRELTPEIRFLYLAMLLGGISLVFHEFLKRYYVRSLPLRSPGD